MGVIRIAVASAVVALVAGQQLSAMTPAQRAALWSTASAMVGASPPTPPMRVAAMAAPVDPADPPATLASDADAEILTPDRYGQFQTTVEIDGQRLPAMVDTGATLVALRYEDADRLGIRPAPSDFRYATSTANGLAMVAKVELPSVRLGAIVVRDVTALVGQRGQLGQTLRGMSFLSRLSSVRMDHGRLLLTR